MGGGWAVGDRGGSDHEGGSRVVTGMCGGGDGAWPTRLRLVREFELPHCVWSEIEIQNICVEMQRQGGW